jgi:predicted ATPase
VARLLGLKVKNYRGLSDFSIGRIKYGDEGGLPNLVCLIGPNGAGKSTVLDAFGFIADALANGVEAACDRPGRGGFHKLRTQGSTGPIEFELFFEDVDSARPIVYAFSVDTREGVPVVIEESLRQRNKAETRGKPYYFLKLKDGKGTVWSGQDEVGSTTKDSKNKSKVSFADQDKLGITTLGNLPEHPRIVRLREYIEGWYLSYFVPDAARTIPSAGAQPFLDRSGSNIGNVLQYYERQHKKEFQQLLKRLSEAIPGLRRINTQVSADGRLLVSFDEQGYEDPFFQQSMSDGTLKMLAYALLLEAPNPKPFIGLEEPENGLYVELIEQLARSFVAKTTSEASPTQILVTTHSPMFVDALVPEQVWMIRKNGQGHSFARRTSDMKEIRELQSQGLPLGSLWYSNHLNGE